MINNVTLENWKNHKNLELKFTPGINSITGNMGSGKSSVLQAISFALFGTFSEIKSRDLKMEELINRYNNCKKSEIKLEFSDADNHKYYVERNLSKNGASEALLKDKRGNLFSGPQVQEVNKSIARILKVNQNLWLKTVYARQNDIDYFIKITPLKRKNEIDELMGLNKFENARKNIIKLINLLTTKTNEKLKLLDDFDVEDINNKVKEVSNSLEELKSEKKNLQKEIKESEEEKKNTKKEVVEKKDKANELNKIKERSSLIKKELLKIDNILDKSKVEKDRDFEKEFITIKKEISETQSKKQEIREEIEIKRDSYNVVEKRAGILNEKLVDIKQNIEIRQELEKKLTLYSKIKEEFEKTEGRISEKKSLIDTKKGEIENLKRHLGELMVAGDNCPVCSNPLDKVKKQELVSARKKEIFEKESRVELFEKEIANLLEVKKDLEVKNEERKKIINKIESYENLESTKENISSEISEKREIKNKLKEELSEKREKFENLEKKLNQLSEEFIKLQEEKNILEKIKQKTELKKELTILEEKLEENKEVSKELEKIEESYEEIIKKVQQLQTKQEYIVPLIEEKGKRLIDLIKNKEEINKTKRKISEINSRIEFLKQFKNGLIKAQIDLRSELVLAVNEVMSNIWQEIYPYDKWSSIRLFAGEDDYILQLKEVDGEWLSVSGFASGGERMIASLALRIAFAKVLSPNLDLLILDEPTHNLDKNAIETLNNIIEERLSKLLSQVFIITHEERIAESAENIIKIKN